MHVICVSSNGILASHPFILECPYIVSKIPRTLNDYHDYIRIP